MDIFLYYDDLIREARTKSSNAIKLEDFKKIFTMDAVFHLASIITYIDLKGDKYILKNRFGKTGKVPKEEITFNQNKLKEKRNFNRYSSLIV